MSEVELEVGEEVVTTLKKVFRSEESDAPALLTERVVTKRFSGHIVLKGFSDDAVRSIREELKIRIQAAHLGSRVRLIIDMQV